MGLYFIIFICLFFVCMEACRYPIPGPIAFKHQWNGYCVHGVRGGVNFAIRSTNSTTTISGKDLKIKVVPGSRGILPGIPTDVKLERISDDLAGLTLRPSITGLTELGYYLLKVKQEAYPRTYINYTLLNLSDVGYVKLRGSKLIYSCIKILPGTETVEAQIWPLSKTRVTSPKYLEFSIASSACAKNPLRVSREFERKSKRLEQCICNATVYITPTRPNNPGNVIRYSVDIKGLEKAVPVDIELVSNGQTLENWKYSDTTSITLNTKPLENGIYHLQVRRYCGDRKEYNIWCAHDEADVSVSPDIRLNVTDRKDRKDPWSNHADQSNYADPSKVQSTWIPADEHDDVYRIVSAAVTTCTLFVAMMIFTSFAIKCYCDEKRRRNPQPPRYVGARHLFQQRIATEKDINRRRKKHVGDGTISIVYTKDSEEHARRVERLNVALQHRGLRSETIDERTKGAELMRNLIDLGESVATGSSVVIFVVSPILHAMCQVGRARKTLHDIDERMLETFHRLPAVVLNSLKIRFHLQNRKGPQLYAVSFGQECDETKLACNAFVSNHGSLFNSKKQLISLNEDENSQDYKNSITKLVNHLRNTECIYSRIDHV